MDGGRSKNYEPNSANGPAPTGERCDFAADLGGETGPQDHLVHAENDDFVQAGALYGVMDPDERERLAANIAGSLSQVSRDDVIERSIGHFERASRDLGLRLRAAVTALREASQTK